MAKPKYVDNWQELFLDRVRETMRPLAQISRDDDMPNEARIYLYLKDDKEFAELYARAREDRGDNMALEILNISDDGTNDTQETQDGKTIVNHDHITRSKLRVDTRKFLMAKMAPKKYGDKIDIDLNVSQENMTEEQQIERIKAIVPQIAPILISLGWREPE